MEKAVVFPTGVVNCASEIAITWRYTLLLTGASGPCILLRSYIFLSGPRKEFDALFLMTTAIRSSFMVLGCLAKLAGFETSDEHDDEHDETRSLVEKGCKRMDYPTMWGPKAPLR